MLKILFKYADQPDTAKLTQTMGFMIVRIIVCKSFRPWWHRNDTPALLI